MVCRVVSGCCVLVGCCRSRVRRVGGSVGLVGWVPVWVGWVASVWGGSGLVLFGFGCVGVGLVGLVSFCVSVVRLWLCCGSLWFSVSEGRPGGGGGGILFQSSLLQKCRCGEVVNSNIGAKAR